MEIFKLFGRILVDNDAANNSISKTDSKAQGMAKTLGSGIATAGKWALGIGVAAGAVGGAMIGAAYKVGQTADALLDLNSVTGMSTDEIQKWRAAATVAGTSTDAVAEASKKLTKTLDTMSEGTGKASEAAEKLGFSYSELEQMSADERMNAMTQDLSEVEDKTERAKLGTDLLGGAWTDIAPIIDLGSEAMKNAKDNANIIDEDKLKRANDFRISVDQLKEKVGYLFQEFAIKLLPIVETLFAWVTENMPVIQSTMDTAFKIIGLAIGFVVEWISKLVKDFKKWKDANQETIDEVVAKFLKFSEKAMEVLQAIIKEALLFWEKLKEYWDTYGGLIIAVAVYIFDTIKNTIQIALDIIIGIVKTVLAILKGDWEGAWNAIKEMFGKTWENIKTLLSDAIENIKVVLSESVSVIKELGQKIMNGLWEGMKTIGEFIATWIKEKIEGFKTKLSNMAISTVKLGRDIFNGLWDGIKGVWTGISNWVSDKMSWLKDKLTFWKKGKDEMSESPTKKPIDGSHANGLAYVPFDGYRAELHKGERVLTAEENRRINSTETGQVLITGNVFNVKEESDIQRIAKELLTMQNNKLRAQGVY